MTTLYLTKAEEQAFGALPAGLREGWTVVAETLDSYETDKQLSMRARMSTLHKYDAVKRMVEDLMNGKDPSNMSLGDLPTEILPDFYFTIGARGVGKMMDMGMKELKTDDDVRGYASLSLIRHKLLETNASVPSR